MLSFCDSCNDGFHKIGAKVRWIFDEVLRNGKKREFRRKNSFRKVKKRCIKMRKFA
nr:MAG TPA: hypothetical protein [Caudoviricetes sp.]